MTTHSATATSWTPAASQRVTPGGIRSTIRSTPAEKVWMISKSLDMLGYFESTQRVVAGHQQVAAAETGRQRTGRRIDVNARQLADSLAHGQWRFLRDPDLEAASALAGIMLAKGLCLVLWRWARTGAGGAPSAGKP